jgi:hypothetical protein
MAKKKQPTSVRRTISLSAELQKRMDACGETVNWSAIAAQAFAAEVARINVKKEHATMDDVIERLRASQRSGRSELFDEGYDKGCEWAKHEASAIELRRLFRAWSQSKKAYDVENWLTKSKITDREPADIAFYAVIRPYEYRETREFGAEDFWETALDEGSVRVLDEEFVHGFALGANDVYSQVADRL